MSIANLVGSLGDVEIEKVQQSADFGDGASALDNGTYMARIESAVFSFKDEEGDKSASLGISFNINGQSVLKYLNYRNRDGHLVTPKGFTVRGLQDLLELIYCALGVEADIKSFTDSKKFIKLLGVKEGSYKNFKGEDVDAIIAEALVDAEVNVGVIRVMKDRRDRPTDYVINNDISKFFTEEGFTMTEDLKEADDTAFLDNKWEGRNPDFVLDLRKMSKDNDAGEVSVDKKASGGKAKSEGKAMTLKEQIAAQKEKAAAAKTTKKKAVEETDADDADEEETAVDED